MGVPYVTEGTFIHLDPASDAGVLEALNLTNPVIDLAAKQVDSRGAEFPVTTTSGTTLKLRITGTGGTEDFVWNLNSQTFNDAAAFVATHGSGAANATITTSPGGQLRFTLNPWIPIGIENAGWTFTDYTYAGGQIDYDSSDAQLMVHELGHNIGFYDLYNNSNYYLSGYQYANNWDAMADQTHFPHTAYWHKEVIAGRESS